MIAHEVPYVDSDGEVIQDSFGKLLYRSSKIETLRIQRRKFVDDTTKNVVQLSNEKIALAMHVFKHFNMFRQRLLTTSTRDWEIDRELFVAEVHRALQHYGRKDTIESNRGTAYLGCLIAQLVSFTQEYREFDKIYGRRNAYTPSGHPYTIEGRGLILIELATDDSKRDVFGGQDKIGDVEPDSFEPYTEFQEILFGFELTSKLTITVIKSIEQYGRFFYRCPLVVLCGKAWGKIIDFLPCLERYLIANPDVAKQWTAIRYKS